MDNLHTYRHDQIPNHLFTKNELYQMGLYAVTPDEPDALVSFPEQNRTFNLYDIKKTREPLRKQRRSMLTVRDLTVDDILEKRQNRHPNGIFNNRRKDQ